MSYNICSLNGLLEECLVISIKIGHIFENYLIEKKFKNCKLGKLDVCYNKDFCIFLYSVSSYVFQNEICIEGRNIFYNALIK